MMIREAMDVFWRSLRDAWEELMPLALVNLVWFVSWGAPLALIPSFGSGPVAVALLVLALVLGAVSTAGLYQVTDRVAHGKTARFDDWRAGVRQYWSKALLWLLGNVVVALAVAWNIYFYGQNFQANWVPLIQGVWLALALFWLLMQVYFWPVFLRLERPNLWTAWKFAAMLIVASPFYAFLMGAFTLAIAAISVLTGVLLGLMGGTAAAVLGSNAVLTLLYKLGKIPDPRPDVPA